MYTNKRASLVTAFFPSLIRDPDFLSTHLEKRAQSLSVMHSNCVSFFAIISPNSAPHLAPENRRKFDFPAAGLLFSSLANSISSFENRSKKETILRRKAPESFGLVRVV
jgi:hypothetical protein